MIVRRKDGGYELRISPNDSGRLDQNSEVCAMLEKIAADRRVWIDKLIIDMRMRQK